MKTQASLLVVLLGLVLLAGHSHAETEEGDADCLADMFSSLGANTRQMRGLRNFMTKIMERSKDRNGTKFGEKMKYMMRMCTCMDESAETTDAQVCQCAEEIKECNAMHKPNSTTAPEEIKTKFNDWMNCMGDARLAKGLACKEDIYSSPGQMICKIKKIQCSQTE